MILDKKVNVKISSTNFKYYKVLGYSFRKGDIIEVDVKHLQRGTGVKINVKCDVCGSESNIYLQKYNINHERQGYYSCVKCSDKKRKKTNMKKYGSDNVSKNEIIKNKKKITTIKNYGVENPSQSKEIKDRKKETMMKNYGVEYVFQSEELRNNMKKTKFEKYGDENFTNRNKSKETCIEKYGVENPSQLEEIKNKKCETSMKNYGVDYPFKSEKINSKIKLTMLKKYGVEFAMQNRDIFLKSKLTSNKVHKYKDTILYYQGSYEKNFLDLFYNKIDLIKIDKIEYFYKNKKKYYHPDFYYKKLNLIIEIKSDYTFNSELDKNLAKQQSCIDKGYNFIFIINKQYDDFIKIIF